MNIKKHIPNFLTLINLFCGCLLVYYTLLHDFSDFELGNIVVILLSISLLADFLDGMVARLLKVASPIGLQLDSLADLVTFGVFPGFLMLTKMKEITLITGIYFPTPISFIGLLITLFSALRLAKFNVDSSQTSYFKGLATPANTILIFGVYNLLNLLPIELIKQYGIALLIFTSVISIISSLLLVSNIPLFSFKLKSFRLKDILPQLIFLIVSLILLINFRLDSLFFIIILYILLSILFKKKFVHTHK